MAERPRAITPEPLAAEVDPAEVLCVLARMVCQLAVHVIGLHTRTPASFRQIATQELRVASPAEVGLIERFLRGR